MENYINGFDTTDMGVNSLKVLIATLYNPDPVLLACTRLSPNRLILLIDNEPDKVQKESLKLIKNSLGRVLDIKEVKIPVYDLVPIAKEVVNIIELQPREDEIYINITAGRKTQMMGVLLGAYARSSYIKKIAYNPEEDKSSIVYLPILSFKLNDSQKAILDSIDKKKILTYADLAAETELSSAMVYKSITELKQMDFVEMTDKGFVLTDAGKIARL
jgi:CRISPR locus-related DNA-binding protein